MPLTLKQIAVESFVRLLSLVIPIFNPYIKCLFWKKGYFLVNLTIALFNQPFFQSALFYQQILLHIMFRYIIMYNVALPCITFKINNKLEAGQKGLSPL